MNLSQNIASIQNYGPRRYVCYDHNGRFAYIDILEKDNEVWAFNQSGIHGLILESGSPYKGSTEAEAVHKAFTSLNNCSWLKTALNDDNTVEFSVPIVLKDYQLNLFDNDNSSI